jgi:transcriptional regulator with XRE-family HTH domain
MNIEIADKLVELRKKKGLSQEAVAERMGLSRQAISRWERAESAPDMNNLIQLSNIYKVSLDKLLQTDKQSADVIANAAPYEVKQKETAEEQIDKPDNLLAQIPFPFVIPVFIIWGLFGFHESYNWFGKHSPNTMQRFPFPIIITAIYLVMGFIWTLWNPGWIIFLTIPIYFVIAALIKRK